MTQVNLDCDCDCPPLNGMVDSMPLPQYLTISRGQKFSGLQLLQYPRIQAFIDQNRHNCIYSTNDWVEYRGPDATIP